MTPRLPSRRVGAAIRISAAALVLFLASMPARAQQRISIEDAINIALNENINLKKAENQVELSGRAVRSEIGSFLPDLRASVNASRNWGLAFDQTSGTLVREGSDGFSVGLNSSVNLFDGFSKISGLRGAQYALRSDELSRERAEQTVFFNVIQAYLQVLLQQEQVAIFEENLEAQRQQLRRIEEFVRLGARSIADQYQQEVTTANAELNLLDARRLRELNESRLLEILELDPLQEYAFDRIDPETIPIDVANYDVSAMLSESLDRRADVRAREWLIRALQQDVRAARGARLPSLNLSGSTGTSYSSRSDGDFSTQLGDNRSDRVSISLSIPLFNRFLTGTNIHRTRIAHANAMLDMDDLEQSVALEVRQAYNDYQSAVQSLAVTETQVRSASQAAAVEQERYNVGASTLVELTTSRANLVDAESQRAQAIYRFIFQRKVIDYYLGTLQPTDSVLPE